MRGGLVGPPQSGCPGVVQIQVCTSTTGQVPDSQASPIQSGTRLLYMCMVNALQPIVRWQFASVDGHLRDMFTCSCNCNHLRCAIHGKCTVPHFKHLYLLPISRRCRAIIRVLVATTAVTPTTSTDVRTVQKLELSCVSLWRMIHTAPYACSWSHMNPR